MELPEEMLEREKTIKKLEKDMFQAYELKKEIKRLKDQYEELMDGLQVNLEALKLGKYTYKDDSIVDTFGESSLSIELNQKELSDVIVDKFKKLVTEAQFNECIEVSVTKARKVLPELQWGECIVRYPGKLSITLKAGK